MRKFSLTASSPHVFNPGIGVAHYVSHFLVEAPDREHAQQIVEEEGLGSDIQWSTHESLEWKRAWRHGEVKTLTATRIPKGIE